VSTNLATRKMDEDDAVMMRGKTITPRISIPSRQLTMTQRYRADGPR